MQKQIILGCIVMLSVGLTAPLVAQEPDKKLAKLVRKEDRSGVRNHLKELLDQHGPNHTILLDIREVIGSQDAEKIEITLLIAAILFLEPTDQFIKELIPVSDLNAKDSTGDTPLVKAVAHGSEYLVNLLVDSGANPNMQGGGLAPLHTAVMFKQYGVFVYLLGVNDIDINMKDIDGCIPLHRAIQLGYETERSVLNGAITDKVTYICKEYVERLLKDSRLNIDAQNNEGNTPLHCAAELDAHDYVKALLEHKANPLKRNKLGKFPSDLASVDLRIILRNAEIALDPKRQRGVWERIKNFSALNVGTIVIAGYFAVAAGLLAYYMTLPPEQRAASRASNFEWEQGQGRDTFEGSRLAWER